MSTYLGPQASNDWVVQLKINMLYREIHLQKLMGNFWPSSLFHCPLHYWKIHWQPLLFPLTICHCEVLACRLRIRIQDLQWLVKRNPWNIYFSCYIRKWLVQRLFLFEKIWRGQFYNLLHNWSMTNIEKNTQRKQKTALFLLVKRINRWSTIIVLSKW